MDGKEVDFLVGCRRALRPDRAFAQLARTRSRIRKKRSSSLAEFHHYDGARRPAQRRDHSGGLCNRNRNKHRALLYGRSRNLVIHRSIQTRVIHSTVGVTSPFHSLAAFRPPPEFQEHDRDKSGPQHKTPDLDLEAEVDMALTEIVTKQTPMVNQVRRVEPFRAAPRCQT